MFHVIQMGLSQRRLPEDDERLRWSEGCHSNVGWITDVEFFGCFLYWARKD